jgi:hypothetical protein
MHGQEINTHLSESAFTYTAQKDKVEKIDIAVKIYGLERDGEI